MEGNPSYEDFTTYTEVDTGNNRIQVSQTHIDHNATRNEDTYVYKDFGENYFDNFTHLLEVTCDYAIEGCYSFSWILSNDLDDGLGLIDAVKTFLSIDFFRHAEYNRIQFLEFENGNYHSDTWNEAIAGIKYYLTIEKEGTDFSVEIRIDSHSGELKDTLTKTLQVDYEFQYIIIGNTFNSGDGEYSINDYDNLSLQQEEEEEEQYNYISWYRGTPSISPFEANVGFETSVDGITWTPHEINPVLQVYNCSPYVVQDDECFYMFVLQKYGEGGDQRDLFMYNVTDFTNPQIMNEGNAVYVHSEEGSDWDNRVYNPAFEVVDGVWHMMLEGSPSGSYLPKLGYSYSNLTELDWNIHQSGEYIVDKANPPYLVHVPERNALLLIHANLTTSDTTITAMYASLGDDLSLSESWNIVNLDRFQINKTGIHISDPHAMWNFNDTYPTMISYNYDQETTYQTYCSLSLKRFYDACVYGNNTITLIDEPSNPTRTPDDEWEGTVLCEQSDFRFYVDAEEEEEEEEEAEEVELWLPMLFILGMIGLVSMIGGPIYAYFKIKNGEYYEGCRTGLLLTVIGFTFTVAWLWV